MVKNKLLDLNLQHFCAEVGNGTPRQEMVKNENNFCLYTFDLPVDLYVNDFHERNASIRSSQWQKCMFRNTNIYLL